MESMGNTLHQISLPADLSLADFRRNMESYSEFRKKSMPLRILLDMITSSKMDIELQQEFPKNLALVERAIKNHEWEQTPWSKIIHAAISYSEKYHFFHWELEFPDAYTDVRRGFDLVIMNPPWDAVKPEDDDFFSFYYPAFRKMKSKPEKKYRFGSIDILVNVLGASSAPSGGFSALSDNEWQKELNINLLAAVRLDRGLLPSMIKQGT